MMFTKLGDESLQLQTRIQQVVSDFAMRAPRSQQRSIGMSEVGEECARKTSFKILDWARTNPVTDPWASISGTAIHAWLAEAFKDQFDGEENPLYLVEHSVSVDSEISGTCDLFDLREKMVIDHKCVGATSMKSRKKDGMTHTQRVQINLYALGIERQGYEVEKVALAFYPLGGRLDGLYTIVEPYNRQLALDAIQRLDDIKTLLWQLDPEDNPENWKLIPTKPSMACTYCPWFLPKSNDTSQGCRGEEEAA